jgi:hypothetical protein
LRVWKDNFRIDLRKTKCYISDGDKLPGYVIVGIIFLLILIPKICVLYVALFSAS